MNFVFIMKISTMLRALFMQSETENPVELEASVPSRYPIKSFELFEEYSRRGIAETIKERREIYEKADSQGKRKIETEADTEISNFQIWLESVKKLAPQTAHHYSIGLKSLLIGVPTGLKVAQLFSSILETI
jgi:hypothetical protein